MHLHNALFRAVENRRALVRATNTGVSCAVDPKGIISACIEDKQGTRLLVAGAQSAEVPLGSEITFYTKFPLAFTFVCFLAILILFIILAGRDRAGRAC
jgi:apolipoprotein N-acyltransferase